MQKDEDKEICCTVCTECFTLRHFQSHKRTEGHREALKRQQTEKRLLKSPQPQAHDSTRQFLLIGREHSFNEISSTDQLVKKRYKQRTGAVLLERAKVFHNTLAAFYGVLYALDTNIKKFEISMNDMRWLEFGDIVIEVTNGSGLTEIHAVQIKQPFSHSKISADALKEEAGKFSLKKQCQILTRLKRRGRYDTVNFIFHTSANFGDDRFNDLRYDEDSLTKWKNRNDKDEWLNKKISFEKLHTTSSLLMSHNTTDEPEDIAKIQILHEGENGDDFYDLSNFTMFLNQKQSKSLKKTIHRLIQEKFGNVRDISQNLINYVGECFAFKGFACKLTKCDVVLKLAEILLSSYMRFPEVSVEKKQLPFWPELVQKFDMTIIRDDSDDIKCKIYASINNTLSEKIGPVNTCLKFLTINKTSISDCALRSQLFDNHPGEKLDVSVKKLYILFWQLGYAPLVLTGEHENDFILVLKLISHIKSIGGPMRNLVLITRSHSVKMIEEMGSREDNDFKFFSNLEGVKKLEPRIYDAIIRTTEIPILIYKVFLKDIVELNEHFGKVLRPDVLLDIFYRDYSIENFDKGQGQGQNEVEALTLSNEVIQKILQYQTEKMTTIDEQCGELLKYELHFTEGDDGEEDIIVIPIPFDI